ncbi:MAG: cytidylate kinase-like family protein [Deltaproteobacteria bacterium]|nr:cytidylate kinase-like family protein [Deltaproteobacteria bacterium]MBW1848721.1 cytidylate kinase-like family protein [Deltaproteobacteria bacterium]
MKTQKRSIPKIIEEQVKKWQLMKVKDKKEAVIFPVIAISREPGSGGRIVATELGKKLGFDVFHQEIINEMAESAQVNTRVLETLDEKGLSVLEDWITSLVNTQHLWPDQYLRHLMKVIGTVGKHGNAVIVGRGANFVLPPEGRIRVRIVAPLDVRVENVSRNFGVSAENAKRRIIRTESERSAFTRKYFNADIADPINYDLVLNTGTLSIEAAADAIKSASES